MHRTLTVLVAALFIVLAAPARADVGPPPTCPPGTYHTYNMGHKCVPNGSHLERDPEGGLTIVKDGALGTPRPKPTVAVSPKPNPFAPDDPLNPFPPPAPATSASAAPAASASAFAAPAPVAPAPVAPASAAPVAETPASPAASPPPQRGCTCGVPGAPEEPIALGVVIAAMFFAVSRRIRMGHSKH